MTKFNKGQQTRQDILNAAKSILLTKGSGALSVDAVCSAVSLSKGAFFYHFKTRDDLLKDLLKDLSERQNVLFEKYKNEDVFEFGKGLRAYIRATLSLVGEERENAKAACRCMIEMIFSRTNLLKEFGMAPGFYEYLLSEEMRCGMGSKQALIILLACEGLWYDQSLEVCGVDPRKIDEVVNSILALTRVQII